VPYELANPPIFIDVSFNGYRYKVKYHCLSEIMVVSSESLYLGNQGIFGKA
jgi:hypothetical protein